MLLLIGVRGAPKVLFSIRKSHLIGPPPILLEHGALPYIWVYICFSPQNIDMLCHASLCHAYICPHYKLYTWKLNHKETVWDKMWSLREYIENWGTPWETDGNTMRRDCEQMTKQKIAPFLQKPKRKNLRPTAFSLASRKFLFPKWFVTIFNLDL
jgi:hypothetical protein